MTDNIHYIHKHDIHDMCFTNGTRVRTRVPLVHPVCLQKALVSPCPPLLALVSPLLHCQPIDRKVAGRRGCPGGGHFRCPPLYRNTVPSYGACGCVPCNHYLQSNSPSCADCAPWAGLLRSPSQGSNRCLVIIIPLWCHNRLFCWFAISGLHCLVLGPYFLPYLVLPLPVFRLHGLNLTSLINARQAVLSCASSNHLLRQTLVSSVVELSAGNPSFILVSGDTVAAALFSSRPLPRLCIIACPHVRCCPPCEEEWWGVT